MSLMICYGLLQIYVSKTAQFSKIQNTENSMFFSETFILILTRDECDIYVERT